MGAKQLGSVVCHTSLFVRRSCSRTLRSLSIRSPLFGDTKPIPEFSESLRHIFEINTEAHLCSVKNSITSPSRFSSMTPHYPSQVVNNSAPLVSILFHNGIDPSLSLRETPLHSQLRRQTRLEMQGRQGSFRVAAMDGQVSRFGREKDSVTSMQ